MRALRFAATAGRGTIAVAALLLAGCAGKPPVISRVHAQPVYVRDLGSGATYARVSVFMVASDPDGREDLAALYVIQDAAELYWKLESDAWVTATAEGESWIGTNDLAMPDGSAPPEGTWRVVLQDLAGETVEDSFTFPRLEPPAEAAFPKAALNGGDITVTGAPASAALWFFSADGKVLRVVNVPKPDASGSSLIPSSRLTGEVPGYGPGTLFWVYGWDQRKLHGVLSGPYSVR